VSSEIESENTVRSEDSELKREPQRVQFMCESNGQPSKIENIV
jgi:hypothetical protein